MNRTTPLSVPRDTAGEPAWLELVRQRVDSLRYGVVQIVLHDGHVTQIEYTERVRLDNCGGPLTRADQPTVSATTLNA